MTGTGFKLIIALFFFLSANHAYAAPLPRSLVQLNAVEQDLFGDLADGRLQQFNLIETGLVASGVKNQAALQRYHEKYKRISQKIKAKVAPLKTKHEKARAVHTALHNSLFKRYQVYANSLTEVFDSGRYNCVSAAIIENAILKDLGIRTQAVRSPTHVYSLVHTNKGAIEIENTTPDGFNPIRSKSRWRKMLQRQRSQMKREDRESIASFIKAIDANQRTVIDNHSLVAALYSNTGVLRSRAGSKRSQLSNFIKAALLSKGDPIYVETMEALLHNQIVYFMNLNQKEKALAAMEDTAVLVGGQSNWKRKFKDWKIALVDNEARILAQSSRYSKAVEAYDNGLKNWPNSPLLLQNRRVALLEWAEDLIGQNKCRLGLNRFVPLFDERSDQVLIQNRYVHSIKTCSDRLQHNRKSKDAVKLVSSELKLAKQRFKGRDKQKNIGIIENLLAEAYFNAGEFENAATWFRRGLPQTRQNYVAAINNQVAELIDQKKYRDAILVASSGQKQIIRYGRADATLEGLIWQVVINEAHRLYQSKQYKAALAQIQQIPNNQRPKNGKTRQGLSDIESAIYIQLNRYGDCIRTLSNLPRRLHSHWVDKRMTRCKQRR